MEIIQPPIKQELKDNKAVDAYLEELNKWIQDVTLKLVGLAQSELVVRYIELQEQSSEPDTPVADRCRIYLRDNGSGKNQLIMKSDAGNTIQICVDT